MEVQLPKGSENFDAWKNRLDFFSANDGERWKKVQKRLADELAACNPAPQNGFRALCLTPPDQVKVVILGMDPYRQEGRATGLAFSFFPGEKPKGSLCKIYAGLSRDLGISRPDGNLADWSENGVLLLNSCLTVEVGEAGSHIDKIGWEALTREMLEHLRQNQSVHFLIWGADAFEVFNHACPNLVDTDQCTITAHPTASAGFNRIGQYFPRFSGSKPFSKANDWLTGRQIASITWGNAPPPAPPG